MSTVTFKKGEKVRTEDDQVGEILFIDRNGLEAQVALERISKKIRIDSLRKFESEAAIETGSTPSGAIVRPTKGTRLRRK